jgi:ABC-2 type transport system ATP-binding protein
VTSNSPAHPDLPAIDAHGLGVRYNLRFTKKTTVRQSFSHLLKRRDGPTHFWALKDVTFRVDHGESLAVIGPNGAGKSTLLQVLAGIIEPSEGQVAMRGKVSSLLTLGAGFDTELTGVDNILLAGAFMGIDDREMRARLPEIVDFADIGAFIDAPLKTYSSGMRARLGFSIATSIDPDILLLDEVLATGDAAFRAKSKARVIEIVRAAKAVVLVTHDMGWVTEYCNRAILIEKGRVVMDGEPAEVVALHQAHTAEARERRIAAAERPVWIRGSSGAAEDQGSGQRRRTTRTSSARTAPRARAPRQSSSGRMSPRTSRAMTTPTAAGFPISTEAAMTVPTAPCSRCTDFARTDRAPPWLMRASPATTRPAPPISIQTC